ncbi:MAG: PEGA domain-containing protein [Proteobacteria bacterium]|nr:PEGA domain-containing protein [Pseudomonadota bacterium]
MGSVPRAHVMLAPAAVLLALALASGAAPAAEKVAVVPIENNAKLSVDEVAILTNAVVAALSARGADFEIVLIPVKPGETCNRLCVFNRAKVTGARYLVTGAVVLFDKKYALKFEAQDRITDTLVASANTPTAATLQDILPLARDAAESIRDDLAPAPAQPIAPQDAPIAPEPEPPPPAAAAESSCAQGFTGELSVTSSPPGAVVRLRSPTGFGLGALGKTGRALSSERGGSTLGATPVRKRLYQGMYDLRVSLEGYETERGLLATVYVGETTSLHVVLEQSKPLLAGGVALTFSGTIVTVVGAILAGMGDDAGGSTSAAQAAGIVILISGGAMVVSGVTMWIVHFKRQKAAQRRGALAVLPTRDGLAMGYARSF